MILSKVYEDAECRLERNEITLGEFERLVDIEIIVPKRGEWIEHKERTIVRDNNFIDFFPTEYECSNCGLRQATCFINSTLPNFCPNCGAKMKGADDDL